MNPALLFLILVTLITAVVLWIVLRPLLRAARSSTAAPTDAGGESNLQALRVELAEARRDHRLGLLSDAALAEAERELEARVLAESNVEAAGISPRYKRTAIALGILLPVLAVAGYAAVGSPAGVVPDLVRPPQAQTKPATPEQADQQMSELFRLAEERLKSEPNDVKGWILLARAKASVGMFEGAMQAYEKAAALTPNDSDIWSDYADAAAGQAQGRMQGKPIELVNKALALDGKNAKALLLRGTWEMQNSDFSAAEKSFTQARALVDAGSGFAQIADNALADIKARTGRAPGNEPVNPAASAATPIATVQLELADDARKAAAASGSPAVFVIVRAASATGADRGPPLAAKKVALTDIDKPVQFSAADAMIGGAGLQPGADVTVQARLSLGGQPMARAGDWQSTKTAVRIPAPSLRLRVDKTVPR